MSTSAPNETEPSTSAAPPVAETPAAPGTAPAEPTVTSTPAPVAEHHRLSTFLKVSVILLVALSVAAIALVFVGDFEGKVERIVATFLVFAVFVGLTAADTRLDQRNNWYAPVALIANAYVLALLLIVIWMSEGGYFLGVGIFWKAILVIVVVRAVVGCCQLLLGLGSGRPEALSRFAFITSVLAVISGILFTAPLAIEVFDVEIPELYWKFGVAALMLTGLGLAVTLLVRWSYGAQSRELRRQHHLATAAVQPTPAPATPLVTPSAAAAQQPTPPAAAQPLLPWPRFADGRPLPALPDGRPDFSVPGAPQPPQ